MASQRVDGMATRRAGRGCASFPDMLTDLSLPHCQAQTPFGGFAQQRCLGRNLVARFRLGANEAADTSHTTPSDEVLAAGALCATTQMVMNRIRNPAGREQASLDDCHLVAHEIGRELWRVRTGERSLSGAELVATTRDVLSICPHSCIDGCGVEIAGLSAGAPGDSRSAHAEPRRVVRVSFIEANFLAMHGEVVNHRQTDRQKNADPS